MAYFNKDSFVQVGNSLSLNNNSSINITTGSHLNFADQGSGVPPSTNLLSIPVSIDVFGGTANLLGKADAWVTISISGIVYKIPCYR